MKWLIGLLVAAALVAIGFWAYGAIGVNKVMVAVPERREAIRAVYATGMVRAEQIAKSTGSSIGSVRTARMGVLQITPADSTEVSDSGMNDTSSLEKDITAVVNIGFAVD